jgi:uncharacterized membrane protein YfcA
MSQEALWLALITLGAATVNGALGYGFSSITVPLALLFLWNRILNPALILIEVPLNAYVLWVNRDAVPAVWPRIRPIVVGLVPGVLAGTRLLNDLDPDWLKLYTYLALLAPILFQAAGVRRPIRSERSAGLVFGAGLGVLYSVTTISGPPLAIALNNQGLAKHEFRAALGVIRLAESSFTLITYLVYGLVVRESIALVSWILPSVLIGVPIGAQLIRRMRSETFRRVCMSFDAWIVAFGLSRLLRDVGVVRSRAAYLVLAGTILLDAWLLYRFFSVHDGRPARFRAYLQPRETSGKGRT